MFYTESAMERFISPCDGEMRQTSNFLPGSGPSASCITATTSAWRSVISSAGRATRLEFAARRDGGIHVRRRRAKVRLQQRIRRLQQREPHFAGRTQPSELRGGFRRHRLGLCTRADRRSLRLRPDYPNNVVRIEPTFPAGWDHAAIRTPDFALEFKGATYKLALTQPAKVNFGIPVRARKVKRVTVDGQPVKFSIEPWAGYGMLAVQLPETKQAVLVVDTVGEPVQLRC